MLEFDFTSPVEGEVHGIGLDTDTDWSADRFFQLYGTQPLGLQDYNDYASVAPDTKHYTIPVGQFYTGQMNYMMFGNDHDVSNPTGESYFSNIRVYEQATAPAGALLVSRAVDQIMLDEQSTPAIDPRALAHFDFGHEEDTKDRRESSTEDLDAYFAMLAQ